MGETKRVYASAFSLRITCVDQIFLRICLFDMCHDYANEIYEVKNQRHCLHFDQYSNRVNAHIHNNVPFLHDHRVFHDSLSSSIIVLDLEY